MNRAVTTAERNWRLETGTNLGLRHDISLWYRLAVTSVDPVRPALPRCMPRNVRRHSRQAR
jgi:hypothetical protein